jgi:ABC-type polysaccharide/polyol phosphate export permease
MNWTVLLWIYVFAVFMLFAGYSLFRRLRPFFAEVL